MDESVRTGIHIVRKVVATPKIDFTRTVEHTPSMT